MVVSAQFADVWTAVMGDRVVLTIPAEPRFRSVATLVVGGIGSRADLPYERADDLQLAVLSALDAGIADEMTVEVDASDGRLEITGGDTLIHVHPSVDGAL